MRLTEGIDVERRPQCLAMVTPAWPPGGSPNGVVTYLSHLAPAFRDRGLRLVLLAWEVAKGSQSGTRTEDHGDLVDISEFQPGRGLLGKAEARARRMFTSVDFSDAKFTMLQRAVRSALERFPIELVEIEEAFGLATRIIKLKRVPVVTRLQGPWFLNGEVLGEKKDGAFRLRVEQERLSIAWADAITAPCQDILDRTREYYGLPLDGARVIACPIEPLADDPAWKLAASDRNRIVFVGRFDLHKGADVMIEAFARLACSRPTLSLDFVGPDRGIPDSSGRLVRIAEYVQRLVPDPAIAHRIVLHGQKPAAQIDAYRRRGIVTVVPSRYETFGYTAAEALRLGCPLVAADSGGLRELVRDGETGLLFRNGDPRSLAAQIDRLLAAPELGARLGEAGRRDIDRRYSPVSIAETTLDLYASVVERWKSKSRRSRGPAETERMTILVPITLFGWVPCVMLLFLWLPPRRAVIAAFIGGWLFLPAATFQLPGIPDYSKMAATCAGVLLAALIFDTETLLSFRPKWFDVPMLVWCLCPFATNASENIEVYDSLSWSVNQVITWGMPYFIGRVYFTDAEAVRELAIGFFIGGLVYIPICLFEIRMSPQLSKWLYGFDAGFSGQRLGGWRPTGLMASGLMLGMWMTATSLCAVWLWYTGSLKRLGRYKAGTLAFALVVVTILCKSTGASVLLMGGLGLLWAIRYTRFVYLYLLLCAIPIAYPIIRTGGMWDGSQAVAWAKNAVGEDRAKSLRFRFKNENILSEKALKRADVGLGPVREKPRLRRKRQGHLDDRRSVDSRAGADRDRGTSRCHGDLPGAGNPLLVANEGG